MERMNSILRTFIFSVAGFFVVIFILIFTKQMSMDNDLVKILFFSGILFVVLGLFYGLVGPKYLRTRMQKMQVFIERDSSVIPIDPYKDISKAVDFKNAPQFSQRLKNIFKAELIGFIFVIIILLITVLFIYLY